MTKFFFIAPVYNDLLNDWQWKHKEHTTSQGITHHEFSIDKDPQDYVDLGNKMLSGFVSTMEKIGDISTTGNNVIESFGLIGELWEGVKEKFSQAKDWFMGLFD